MVVLVLAALMGYRGVLCRDRVMRGLVERQGPRRLVRESGFFVVLCRAIVSQQVSNAAAAAIWGRFVRLFSGRPTPRKLLSLSEGSLRAAGLSWQKVSYLRSLAEYFSTPRRFAHRSDEEVIEELTSVRGVGRWTAEMFLIFSLGREDVFAFDDLGLMNTLGRLYFGGRRPSRREAESVVARWRPYRSFASLYLWGFVDDGGGPWSGR